MQFILAVDGLTTLASRRGIIQLASALGVFGDVSIVSGGPPTQRPLMLHWLQTAGLSNIVAEVYFAASGPRPAGKSALLLDCWGGLESGTIPSERSIRWTDEPWLDLLLQILHLLAARTALRMRVDAQFVVQSVQPLSDRGGSPALLLTGTDGSRRKLRLCLDAEIKGRMEYFLRATEEAGWPHAARLVDTRGIAIVKTFLNGRPLLEASALSRPAAIASIAHALANLHRIHSDPDRPTLQDASAGVADLPCHLVCAADDYNVVVTPNHDVAFVDLEASTVGSRWIDLAWAEELLCHGQAEIAVLWRSYEDHSGLRRPTGTEWNSARAAFLRWLLVQLDLALITHPGQEGIQADRCEISQQLLCVQHAITAPRDGTG